MCLILKPQMPSTKISQALPRSRTRGIKTDHRGTSDSPFLHGSFNHRAYDFLLILLSDIMFICSTTEPSVTSPISREKQRHGKILAVLIFASAQACSCFITIISVATFSGSIHLWGAWSCNNLHQGSSYVQV